MELHFIVYCTTQLYFSCINAAGSGIKDGLYKDISIIK